MSAVSSPSFSPTWSASRHSARRVTPSRSRTWSTDASSGSGVSVNLVGAHVPNNSTSCLGAVADGLLWVIRDLGDGVTPLSFTFPTPLQFKPPANTKACLYVNISTAVEAWMNAVGFYGG